MTPYERVMNRLSGAKVDKIPNFAITMLFSAEYSGIPFSRYCLDYRSMVRANIKCSEDFGIDILGTMSDAVREAFDYGLDVEFPFDELPRPKAYFIRDYGDIKKLKPFGPRSSIRINDRIRAVELFKRERGSEYPVMGWVEGAIAEYTDLRGMGDAFMDMYDAPEFVHEILDILTKQAIACAIEQAKAGADIIGVGDAAASQVSPELYREFILPCEKRLFSAINETGAKSRLHICGNISHLLDDIADIGASIVDIDWMVDFKTAAEKLSGRSCVCGNFDPVSVLYYGAPDTIRKAVFDCAAQGGGRSIIMPGCEVPKGTKHENLKAVDEALKSL